MITASAVDAPVTMLRVYCSWPGVSAMMNLRLRRGEVAVGDVDGDALLALGFQAVGQQRQVDGVADRALVAGARHRVELVGEDALAVEQQAADQRALAVVDAAGGDEAQQAAFGLIGGGVAAWVARAFIRNILPSCVVPSTLRRSGRPSAWRRAR